MISLRGLFKEVPTIFELIMSGILGRSSVLSNLHVLKIVIVKFMAHDCVIGS